MVQPTSPFKVHASTPRGILASSLVRMDATQPSPPACTSLAEVDAAPRLPPTSKPWLDTHILNAQNHSTDYAAVHGDGTKYALRVASGLEPFAAAELTELGVSDVVPLLGHIVLFSSSDTPAALQQRIRSAESLSLVCWASPPPTMPTTNSEWLSQLYSLLEEHVQPRADQLEGAWRAAALDDSSADDASAGSPSGRSLRFRVSATRAGGASSGVVTSQQIAAEVGAFFSERCGWVVDLHEYEVDVEVSWHDALVLVALPVARKLCVRPEVVHAALHGPTAWALARLVAPRAGEVVLDPMCGRGGCLIEAARECRGATYLGADLDEAQLSDCAANLRSALRGTADAVDAVDAADAAKGAAPVPYVALLHADATRLPLPAASVDAIVVDMPFGKRHANPKGLYAQVLAEAHRVLRPGRGRIAVLTTARAAVWAAVKGEPGWQPISRAQVNLGGLMAWLHLLRRVATPVVERVHVHVV